MSIIHKYMPDPDEWVEWDCPNCQETHSDPIGIKTHCRRCGTVVIVYEDNIAFDQGEKVPVKPPLVFGYTNMPGGFRRWVCPGCQQENAGNEDTEEQWEQETCQQCGAVYTIAGYYEPRWGVRMENIE
jgi:transcription initiation factor TFIIIB Brf1 subunit/transcription initiation factor TFIIB